MFAIGCSISVVCVIVFVAKILDGNNSVDANFESLGVSQTRFLNEIFFVDGSAISSKSDLRSIESSAAILGTVKIKYVKGTREVGCKHRLYQCNIFH